MGYILYLFLLFLVGCLIGLCVMLPTIIRNASREKNTNRSSWNDKDAFEYHIDPQFTQRVTSPVDGESAATGYTL